MLKKKIMTKIRKTKGNLRSSAEEKTKTEKKDSAQEKNLSLQNRVRAEVEHPMLFSEVDL
jgi:hypothetical protein